jgi:hypothetical protein
MSPRSAAIACTCRGDPAARTATASSSATASRGSPRVC